MIELCNFCKRRHETGNDPLLKICPDVPRNLIVGVPTPQYPWPPQVNVNEYGKRENMLLWGIGNLDFDK